MMHTLNHNGEPGTKQKKMTLEHETIFNTIKVITFDLDDTLWPVKPSIEKAQVETQKWLTKNASKLTDNFTQQDMHKKSIEIYKENPQYTHQISQLRIATIKQLAQLVGYDEAHASEIANQSFLIFIHHRQQVKAYDGVEEVLEFLSKNFLLGSITNGNADIYKTNLGHYFDFSVSSEEINASKPDPVIFKAAYNKAVDLFDYELLPHNILHIGDDYEKDVEGAQKAGFKTAWINPLDEKENHLSLEHKSSLILKSVSELKKISNGPKHSRA